MKKLLRPKSKWDMYYEYENSWKSEYLQKLSVSDGCKLFKSLFSLAFKVNNNTISSKFNNDKLKVLSEIHTIFGKVNK